MLTLLDLITDSLSWLSQLCCSCPLEHELWPVDLRRWNTRLAPSEQFCCKRSSWLHAIWFQRLKCIFIACKSSSLNEVKGQRVQKKNNGSCVIRNRWRKWWMFKTIILMIFPVNSVLWQLRKWTTFTHARGWGRTDKRVHNVCNRTTAVGNALAYKVKNIPVKTVYICSKLVYVLQNCDIFSYELRTCHFHNFKTLKWMNSHNIDHDHFH